MSEKKKEIQEDQELIKALEDLGIDLSTLDLFSKSEEEEEEEKEQEEDESSEEGDEYSKMKSDYDKLSKACSMKKAEMEEYEKKMKSKKAEKSEDSELEKSDNSELLKSILDEKMSSFTNLVKGLEDKIGNLSEENSELKKSIELLGENRPGKKSVNTEFSIIEKGGMVEDESGKKVLSVSKQKGLVCSELEKAMDETDGELQKALASQIVAYNADPYGKIAKPIAEHLYNNRNVRLVK
jgi:hypothetical protein